jgi:hypothetical protein
MSLLSKVSNGVKEHKQISLVYGLPGIGKTTFLSRVGGVLIADIEDSSKALDVARISSSELKDYESLVAFLEEIKTTTHQYKAIAIDSVTTLEHYINNLICSQNGVKEVGEIPYGRGTAAVKEKLKEFMITLRSVANSGIDVWLAGHSLIKKFNDPTLLQQFDRYTLQCNEGFGQEIIRQCDNVYFIKYDVQTSVDKTTKKAKGISDGSRVMYTRYAAGFDAKTRLNLPESIPFDYDEYMKAVQSYAPKASNDIIKDIESLLIKLAPHDQELTALAKEKLAAAKGDNTKLQRIKEKLLDATNAL